MTSEEGPVKMAAQEDNAVRMAGYLDKRGKMKLVSTWKRYWFVLKHQLLLYYKSQLECLNLSACRGSLNMGLASCVRPGAHRGPPASATQGYTIEVVTRTQVIVLRTKDRGLQEQWLKALLESMALPNISTPIKTGGGPIHFRYSMDNLPVVEELETEEKQKTLPHLTTLTRHDSVLGHIKRISGHSYGGSLDTILKHQPMIHVQPQRSPQQPKIPRIRAVDRMLGLQYLKNYERKASLTNDVANEEQCLRDSTYLFSKEKISKQSGGQEIKYNDVAVDRLMDTSSDSEEMRKNNCKIRDDQRNQEAKLSIVSKEENQNHEKFSMISTEEARKYTINFLENQRYLSSLENEVDIIVENKLYETTKEAECDNDEHETENKFYEKVKHGEEGKQYDSEEEICSFAQVHNVPEDEKMYAVVSVDTNGMKEVQRNEGDSEDNGEYDYYSSYTRVSPVHSLSEQLNRTTLEPDLPPRPSVGTGDSSKNQHIQQTSKAEDEEADYSEYYESTDSYNAGISPSQLLSSGGESSTSEKKRSTLHGIKLKKKKSSRKETVASEDWSSNSKKKHRMSFLRRMLKHYHKKSQSNFETVVISVDREDSDEPEYETVDYSAPTLKSEGTEEKLQDPVPRSNNIEIPDKEVRKKKLFGKQNLLRKETMLELKMKLKSRDCAVETAPTAPANEDNQGYECISPDDLPDRKPILTPRSRKRNLNQDKKGPVVECSRYRCNDSINRANKPPSLPPRKVARPRSPWHDVPKNNSPISGNFQDLATAAGEKVDDMGKETLEPTIEKQSEPEFGEWDQNFQDELLGTSRGFFYIQNKWKAAEMSGEWCHDQQGSKETPLIQKSPQKETFPGNSNNAEEIKVTHEGSPSSDSVGCDTVSHEHKTGTVFAENTCTSDIYSDVHKDHLSVKKLIQSFNPHTEKVTDKPNYLYNIDDKNVDEQLNNINDKTGKVQLNNVEIKFSGNAKLDIGSTTMKHNDTTCDRILNYSNGSHNNFNIKTTDFKDLSDDIPVTLRKSQIDSTSNKHEVPFSDTKSCQVVVSGENDSLSSSQLCSGRDIKEMEECSKDKECNTKNNFISIEFCNMSTNSSSQQEIKTLFNNVYNQNMLKSGMAKDLSPRVAENAGMAHDEDITPHLNRHSDELNLLLAQLAEITSAPLLPHSAASSLVDIPEGKKPKPQAVESSQRGPTQPEL
ncbi:hypothetical protein B7P43_G12201 [Cryptotermes secundus]|nr:uncharacterized protein LOC111874754 isoform X3 [Cryptotermes secundus]PNF14262.1 hypothetical protein B7P43_G12201 [Cryptotermes secundus]